MIAEQVNVAIAEDYRDRFSEVVRRVKEVGLKVDQELKDIGVVIGSIEPDKLVDLERVEGVIAAELSREIRIAPPESEVQ